MKQKAVIKASLRCQECRTKALKIAVGVCGVESVALQGEDKNQIEVIGDGFDSVVLIKKLRKKVCIADIVSLGPVDKK